MTADSSASLCDPDAAWTELSMEGRGLLHVCPVLATAPVEQGQALLPNDDEDDGFGRAELTDVLADWLDSEPGDAIFALVHPTDFAILARRFH